MFSTFFITFSENDACVFIEKKNSCIDSNLCVICGADPHKKLDPADLNVFLDRVLISDDIYGNILD